MSEPVEFVDAAQEEWVAEVLISDQPTSTSARAEVITVALRLGVVMLEAGFDTRAAVNAMTGCARALGMADLSVTAVGRTMMASHVSERGVPITMTLAAATIDSFDLYRMGRLHQVLAEMLRDDVDVKRASDLMDQLEQEPSPWPWWVVVLGRNGARGIDHSTDRRQPDSCCSGQRLSAARQPIRCPAGPHWPSESVLRLGAGGIGGTAGGSAECLWSRDDTGFCGNHSHGAGTPASNSSDRPSRSGCHQHLLRHRSGTVDGRPGARLDDDSRWGIGAQPSRRGECHGGGVRHSSGTHGTVARDYCMHGRCSGECGVHAGRTQAAASCSGGGSIDRDRQCRSSTSRFAGPDIGGRDSGFGARRGVRSVIQLPAHFEY